LYTVQKAERDTGPKHEGDGKFHHPRRMIGKICQHRRLGPCIYVGDGIFVTLVFWSCVTLGFSNSVRRTMFIANYFKKKSIQESPKNKNNFDSFSLPRPKAM
jgi:hypothetical protein